MKASWNPFHCEGTELPPVLLMAVKMIAAAMLLGPFSGAIHPGYSPYLPYGKLVDLNALASVLNIVYWLAVLAILFNVRVRWAAMTLGISMLVGTSLSVTWYSDNRVFTGCVLFLMGLHRRGDSAGLLRWQLVLLYLGAGLNKALDPDWYSGVYFQQFVYGWVFPGTPGRWLFDTCSGRLPALLLAQCFGLLTIVTELSLAIGLMFPGLTRRVVAVGIAFHLGILVFTQYTMGLFTIALGAAYLAICDWEHSPDEAHARRHSFSRLRHYLRWSPAVYILVAGVSAAMQNPGWASGYLPNPANFLLVATLLLSPFGLRPAVPQPAAACPTVASRRWYDFTGVQGTTFEEWRML
jgi:hypothetical protein